MRKLVRPSLIPEIHRLAVHQWVRIVPNAMRMMDELTREARVFALRLKVQYFVKGWLRVARFLYIIALITVERSGLISQAD